MHFTITYQEYPNIGLQKIHINDKGVNISSAIITHQHTTSITSTPEGNQTPIKCQAKTSDHNSLEKSVYR